MAQYNKAIVAFVTSLIGLGVSFGFITEPAAQQMGVAATALVNLVLIYAVPNGK